MKRNLSETISIFDRYYIEEYQYYQFMAMTTAATEAKTDVARE